MSAFCCSAKDDFVGNSLISLEGDLETNAEPQWVAVSTGGFILCRLRVEPC
jgi:hypothetical protein